LKTPFRGRLFLAVAQHVLEIAQGGLRRRARRDASGADETRYLAPLLAIAESGRTLADQLLADYHGAWREDIDQVFVSRAL
jgi:glutamate--cysteine ligase